MTITESLLIAGLGATWGGIGLSFAIGKWVRSREADAPKLAEQMKSVTDAILYRVQQLEKAQDRAGGHISDLASSVQGLPERLRTEFVTRAEWSLSERRRDTA